jgi:hypothetical protein
MKSTLARALLLPGSSLILALVSTFALALAVTLASTQSASAQISAPKKGAGGSEVQGSSGTSGSQGASGDLEHCDKPLGAVAVVEPQDYMMQALGRYNLQSPVSLIRLMVQQSNCFLVVERGMGMQNMAQERALAESGQLRQSSNIGGGQMVGADFVLTPAVIFSENDAGGVGAGLGGLLPGIGGRLAGAVAGGVKFKEAQTSMLLADARSGIQVAAAEGSAKKADLRLGGLLLGGSAGATLGGYANTNEGKLLASSLADNYNGIVRAVRNDSSLQRDVGSLAHEAGKKVKTGAVFNEGDVLHPKIANVKLLSQPAETGKVIATLGRGDEMIYTEEQDGYVKVETDKGSGWVKRVLLAK